VQWCDWDWKETDRLLQQPESSEKPFFSEASQGLDAEPGGGVAGEDLADADVSGEHLGRLVAGLAHDVALADSVHRGLGDASGAQAMAAQGLRLQTGAAGGPLQDPADAVLVEPAAGELAMAVDPAKDGTGGDARRGQPAAQRADRAGGVLLPKGNADLAAGCLLVGLRAAEIDDQAVLGEGEVGKSIAASSERRKAPAKPTRMSARSRRPESVSGQQATIRRMSLVRSGALPFLGGADRAADALEGLAHDKVMARRGRGFKSCRLVGLGDRGEPAGDGRRAKGSRAVGDVESDGCGSCRQVGQVVPLAEPGEVLEVGPVGAQGGGGFGGVNVGSGLLDEVFEAGGPCG
jgi:hypothetical protein